jgi:hypothetical protein
VQSTPDDASPPVRRPSPALWVTAVAVVAFLPSLLADYVYDDRLLIAENYYAQSLRFVGRAFRTHLWDVHAFGVAGIGLRYYRPLVSVSYIVNWVLGGGTAWSFHLVNVALHAGATLLATRAAIRWLGSARLGVLVGLVFALHPSRTESVIWISGRTDLFMALFALLAVELAHRTAYASVRRAPLLATATFASMLAAMLSKEAGALTALLLLPDLLLAEPGSLARRRLGRLAALLGVVGTTYIGARSLFYPVHKTHVPFEPTLRYGLFTVWAYVERVVWPWPQTFFYRPMEERGGVPYYPLHVVVLGAATCAAYGFVLVRAFRRDRVAFVLLATALVLLGPLLNFSYTGIYVTTSDHFLYLPLPIAAAGAFRLYRDSLEPLVTIRAAALAIGGLCLLYTVVDAERVLDYRSEEALLRHELDVNADNPVALQNLAGVVARDGDMEGALALQARVVAPSSSRYFLLAGTPSSRFVSKARLIGLEAALTADGDVVALGKFEYDLEQLLFAMRAPEDNAVLTRAGVFAQMSIYGQVAAMAADTALVASRVGRVQVAKSLVDAIPDDMLWHTPSPLNFVLTVARLGDFKRAARLVHLAGNPPPGLGLAAPREALTDIGKRLDRARRSMRAALHAAEPAAHVELSLSFAELGAYLQALRVLRPVFDTAPHGPDVDPLYVQLLVSAGLQKEATRVATSLLGEARGVATVENFRAQLTPRLRSLPPVPEPSPWWP